MKIENDFILRQIAGDYLIIPTGEAAIRYNGMIMTNETGALLWQQLQQSTNFDQLVHTLVEEYEIDEKTARQDAEEFLSLLREKGILKDAE